jgi:hypothetical protein
VQYFMVVGPLYLFVNFMFVSIKFLDFFHTSYAVVSLELLRVFGISKKCIPFVLHGYFVLAFLPCVWIWFCLSCDLFHKDYTRYLMIIISASDLHLPFRNCDNLEIAGCCINLVSSFFLNMEIQGLSRQSVNCYWAHSCCTFISWK